MWRTIKNGGVAVIPTDTLYGIVAPALHPTAVERVYTIKHRSTEKPCIVLLPDSAALKIFSVSIDADTRKILSALWPGPYSVLLPCAAPQYVYLHRNSGFIAFRVPKNVTLQKFLSKTGPLIAPSANLEGKPPAETIDEAKNYFGNAVDAYIDGGHVSGKASTLLTIERGVVKVLRP